MQKERIGQKENDIKKIVWEFTIEPSCDLNISLSDSSIMCYAENIGITSTDNSWNEANK